MNPRPPIRQTHTIAILDVPPEFYAFVREKLLAARYEHAISSESDGETIDMHGIGLRADPTVTPRFKPDVAYMEVPRCDSCKWWERHVRGTADPGPELRVGDCAVAAGGDDADPGLALTREQAALRREVKALAPGALPSAGGSGHEIEGSGLVTAEGHGCVLWTRKA